MSMHQNTLISTEKMPQEAGQGLKLNRGTMYLPLIDASLTDPPTMMTALEEAIWLTDQTCQLYNIITSNHQLYKVLVDIKRVHPLKYSKVIFRLDSMYLMISFINCMGNLMSNSSLDETLTAETYGKKFPQIFHTLRMFFFFLLT